jgi:hypothetical protein
VLTPAQDERRASWMDLGPLARWPGCMPRNFVPNFVPGSAIMTRANPSSLDLTPRKTGQLWLQAPNHNPRVGGSSPSSGMAIDERLGHACFSS